jgi:hypothetical protein
VTPGDESHRTLPRRFEHPPGPAAVAAAFLN